MSEAEVAFFEPTFNRAVKVRSRDHRLSSDAGLLLLREADHRLALIESLTCRMYDPRDPDQIRYPLTELLRERIYGLTQGYNVADDADLLAQDPIAKIAVWDRPGQRVLEERLASQPTQSRLVDTLSRKKNLEVLRSGLSEWVGRHLAVHGGGRLVQRATIDIDGFPVTTCGKQPGSAMNGYYKDQVYYPLVAGFAPEGRYDSSRIGDGFVHAILRKGNAAGAEGALRFILKAVEKCSNLARHLDLRMDAAFMIGRIMDPLKARNIKFVGRLTSNKVLQALARPHLKRPVGRPPSEGYEFTVELGWHQAESWIYPQRLVLVVVDKPDPKTGQLDLFPKYFFLVTTWTQAEKNADELLHHYRGRGTFEDRIGELSQAISPHLSSPEFDENEVLLLLALLAQNLGSMLRAEMESATGNGWDLGRLQRSVLRTGARVVKGGRRLLIDIASAAVALWTLLLRRIRRWTLASVWPRPRGPTKRPWVPPPRHAHLRLVLRE